MTEKERLVFETLNILRDIEKAIRNEYILHAKDLSFLLVDKLEDLFDLNTINEVAK